MCVAAEKECSNTLDKTATFSLQPDLAETILGLKRELVSLRNIQRGIMVNLESLIAEGEKAYAHIVPTVRKQHQQLVVELEQRSRARMLLGLGSENNRALMEDERIKRAKLETT
ncbi:hypothetical protein MMC29_001795 [Sticta canariensis]|nr:hypothetical protein [Sticta canariensis]